jgi:large subunit ribosomal protein L25
VKVNPKIIRRGGKIPAVFYGQGQESTPIMVDKIAFMKLFGEVGESTIFTLETPKGKVDALVHDVDLDPVIGDPIHVDFYITAKDHKLQVDVPFEFVGVSPVEKMGGSVVRIMHEIRIEALPAKLPAHITVDVSKIEKLESHISVGGLNLGEGVTTHVALTELVAVASGPREEKEDIAPVAADLSSIEVEKKGKKEEEEVPAE